MHYWPEASTCYHYLSIPPRDGGAVSVATTKTTRATGHGAGLTLDFLFSFLLSESQAGICAFHFRSGLSRFRDDLFGPSAL